MQTIAFLNLKGGVGKTSSVHHLSGTLAASGRRVLLIDNDPQASLTQGFFGPDATEALDPSQTVQAIYTGDPLPGQVVVSTTFDRIDLVPGSYSVSSLNNGDPHLAPWETRMALARFLGETSGYDLCLIDCPPNLALCSWAALAAADSVVVPLQPEDYGSQGIRRIHELLGAVRASDNPAADLLGYLITRANLRKAIHKAYAEAMRTLYGDLVFATEVPDSVDILEATSGRKPVIKHKPRGAAAKAIQAIADEMLARLAGLATQEGRAA